ncbi:hypothetical protein F2P81_011654 [Scophthalmus maximus]|uniref:Uncharacterized protein n=1 Tax=Scophthalmus maximus TaxID=52904 RepID=A0A6A4T298_SCOMX|nr:hypothetical protein F2P81_011654 [Scophthalmus maximus]
MLSVSVLSRSSNTTPYRQSCVGEERQPAAYYSMPYELVDVVLPTIRLNLLLENLEAAFNRAPGKDLVPDVVQVKAEAKPDLTSV